MLASFISKFALCIISIAALVFSIQETSAHPGIDKRIESLTGQIRSNPENSRLLISRAELHIEHEDWRSALDDLDQAKALDPNNKVIDFHLGRLYFEQQRLSESERILEQFIQNTETSLHTMQQLARALLILGQIMESTRRWEQAADYYDRVIQHSVKTNPGFYIARARALVSSDPPEYELALAGLDSRLAEAPGLVALAEYAIHLERERHNHAGAIGRTQQMIKAYPQVVRWQLMLASIQLDAGLMAGAKDTYLEARILIDELPARLREKAERNGTVAEIEKALAALGSLHD